MKKVQGVFNITVESVCPYCNDVQKYDIDKLEKLEDDVLNPLENIIRGIVKLFSYGTTEISETVMNCSKCKRKYIINHLDR